MPTETTTSESVTTANPPETTTSESVTSSETSTSTTVTPAIIPVYGDVDNNGKSAEITDVVLLSKQITKKITLNADSIHYINADCNQKGSSLNSVDASDLKTLIDKLLGKSISFPLK
jgi:hypothetical protein